MAYSSYPPADRTAVRRDSFGVDPVAQRRRIGELLETLPPGAYPVAAEVAALWPRLVHQLARRGALTAPAAARAL